MFDDTQEIQKALTRIKDKVNKACIRSQRCADDVKILLATKTVSPRRIKIAMDQGYSLLGENKAQELKSKTSDPLLEKAEWHFIGHLQTNKIKDVLPSVAMIHSVDRISLAKDLNKRLQAEGRALDILVQVNTSKETSKFGLAPEEVRSFIKMIAPFETLKIKGLMTLALFSDQEELVRPCFKKLKNLFDELKSEAMPGTEMKELSMGMSADFEWAIEEGATIVRIGSKVFGQRPTKDSEYWDPN